MSHHVFAVWDFMSLLKSLQKGLTGMSLPWGPPRDVLASRLINEIVLAEESDEDGEGGYCSHLELYMRAMKDVGADTQGIGDVLSVLTNHRHASEVGIERILPHLPEAVRPFCHFSLELAEKAPLLEVCAAFLFAREDVIPEMFERLLPTIKAQDLPCGRVQYYYQRHIDIDAGHHGPMSQRLFLSLCGDDPLNRQRGLEVALEAIEQRILLWDRISSICDLT